MAEISKEAVERALASFIEPYTGKDIVSTKVLKDVRIDGGQVQIDVELGFPSKRYAPQLSTALKEALRTLAGVSDVQVIIKSHIISHAVQKGVTPLPNVKNIIAVASGKGGVGKSTVAVNLALALQAEGATAAVLDADIYGPSQPRMLGAHGRPESKDGKSMEPKVSYGVQSISIGHLIDEETPMIWRGPMVTGALEQLLRDTNWRDVDYLVVDLPPGTGDIQLTLCQKIPVSGAIIVTTPQDIALIDARKALKMFEKVQVPVLGIVENMSTHICSKCGHEEHIFGEGGGGQMAKQYHVDLLGSLPLDIRIREGVDNGRPTVAMAPDSPVAQQFFEIARKVAARIAMRAKDFSARFPKIVIQNT
ncbi:MAG TPA: iron-sulfur cluster carrier protein ApbC [Gammaproteobacteria bacterium]|nr:iron-sulfur cluster carrier protein ApbC [Gammaproteobacteria bacterium]